MCRGEPPMSDHAIAPGARTSRLPERPLTVIQPATSLLPDFRELWRYRELLVFFVWRDMKIKYRQTAIGGLWAIVQPLLTMVVFSVVFGRLAGIGSEGLPYPLFAFAALVPWTYFATALAQASNSVIADEKLITKVYFPRLLIPASAVLVGLIDFAFAFVVLLCMQAWYGIAPGWGVLLLPFFLLLAVITALGAGLWLAALNVQYRDVRYTLPFLVQFWLFATPVAWSSSLLKGNWRAALGINPMAGVVDGFRWALLGQDTRPGPLLIVSVVTASALFVSGALYYRRMEASFADVV